MNIQELFTGKYYLTDYMGQPIQIIKGLNVKLARDPQEVTFWDNTENPKEIIKWLKEKRSMTLHLHQITDIKEIKL